MMRGLAAGMLLLSACSRSTGGPLKPVGAPGVELSTSADGGKIATMRVGAVSVQVSARWSDTAGQSAMLVYANRGVAPVSVEMGALAMSGPAGEAVVMSAADVTDTNLADDRRDNDDTRVLLQRDGDGIAKGRLDLPAGAERRVDAQLSSFSNTKAAAAGSIITLHVPLPSGRRDVRFIAERPSLLPF